MPSELELGVAKTRTYIFPSSKFPFFPVEVELQAMPEEPEQPFYFTPSTCRPNSLLSRMNE